ncbi:MAG: hypothetical protein M3065_13835, partial [Actinomycetota bacterium]|nr:hypothetical protein [Actinomycetota bacterium]
MRFEAAIRPQLRYAAGAACVAAILVVSGWAVTTHYSHRLFLLVGVIALAALAVTEPGAFIGVLVLAAMNGLPFLDTSHSLAHHIAIQDAACIALIGVIAGGASGAGRAARVSGLASVVSWCGLALFLWCAFIVVRT